MKPESLQELGLSDQESRIYLALVELGKSTAGKIAIEAKVSYGTIYRILSQMERKGLVKIVPEKTKKFIATNPKELKKLVGERTKVLENIQDNIDELSKIYDQEAEQPVILAQGKANFWKLLSEMKKPKERDFSVRSVFVYNPTSYRRMKKKISQNVDCRIMYGPNAKKEGITQYKKFKIPMKKISVQDVTMTIKDEEVLIALISKNSTLLIKDKNFADLMTLLFKNSIKVK